jgi:dolichyl-phosphate beta-glucosyltransferase
MQLMITALLPLILDRLLRLAAGGAVRRDAVILGLLTTCQLFLGEEILLITAIGAALYAVGFVLARPAVLRTAARPLAGGLLLGGVVALVLAGFPLHHQLFGPGSFDHLFWTPANKPGAFPGLSGDSLFGDRASAAAAAGPADHNSDFGWPALVLAAVLVVVLRANPIAAACAVMGVGAAVLSLGETIPIGDGSVPGPWRLLQDLPLFNSLIENRLSFLDLPALGILVALGLAEVHRRFDGPRRFAALGVVAVALLPLTPTPLVVQPVVTTPGFFAEGAWKSYVGAGRSVVTVPLPQQVYQDPMHWQIEADLGFALAGGYFVGPSPYADVGVYGAAPRPTSDLFNEVQATGRPAVVTDAARSAAASDLAYWQADLVFVPDGYAAEAKRQTVTGLLGRPGLRVDGGWVWRLSR